MLLCLVFAAFSHPNLASELDLAGYCHEVGIKVMFFKHEHLVGAVVAILLNWCVVVSLPSSLPPAI